VTTAAAPEGQDMTETSEDQREAPAEEREGQRVDGEQQTADVDGDWMNLGPCHYDQEHDAVVVATREDGTGWIAVCEEHMDEAKQNGFEPNRSESSDS
jgi:hypothetical protein